MAELRRWQWGLTAFLLLGAGQAVHMLVDLDATLRFRAELMSLELDAEAASALGGWSVVPMAVAGFVAILLGLLLIWRALHVPAARAFVAFILFWHPPFFWLVVSGAASVPAVARAANVAEAASMVPLMLFAMWFPRRLSAADLAAAQGAKRRGRLRRVIGWPWRRFRSAMLRPRFFTAAALVAVVLAAVESPVASLWVVVALCLSVSYLRAGFLMADDEGKRRSLWILNGFSIVPWILLGGFLFFLVAGITAGVRDTLAPPPVAPSGDPTWLLPALEVLSALVWLCILLSVGAAILYRGAIDPGMVLRKTTVYGALGVLSAFLFAALENVLSAHVAVRLGFPGSGAGWLAGGLVALSIGPLRGRLQKRTDRLIDRVVPPTGSARSERSRRVVMFARLRTDDPAAARTAAPLLEKVAQRTANRCRGRVTKGAEGGALFEFDDATAAVRAAQFTSDAFAAAADVLELPPVPATLGIHAGEPADGAEGEIRGEAVEVVVAIAAAAAPGEVWVSGLVAALLEDGPERPELVRVTTLDLPGFSPVECYRATAAGMLQPA